MEEGNILGIIFSAKDYTIGEMTLITYFDTNFPLPISRTSVADGDFSPFSYNPANALVVVWQIVLGFQ